MNKGNFKGRSRKRCRPFFVANGKSVIKYRLKLAWLSQKPVLRGNETHKKEER